MRATIERIEADQILVADQIRRLGLAPSRMLRIVLETVDEDEPSLVEMNALGGAFDHLADEPDIYSEADLVETNEIYRR